MSRYYLKKGEKLCPSSRNTWTDEDDESDYYTGVEESSSSYTEQEMEYIEWCNNLKDPNEHKKNL